jgi:hypothetical protein
MNACPCGGERRGYQKHLREGTEPCPEARAANARFHRERRATKKKSTPAAPAAEAAPAPESEENPRPGGMPAEFYRRDPRETTPEEDELEPPEPRRVIRAPAPEPEEAPAPEEHIVRAAVVAHGKIEGYVDERFRAPKRRGTDPEDKVKIHPKDGGRPYYEAEEGFEEIDSRHPVLNRSGPYGGGTWIGTIETRAQRRRRNLPWVKRRR